ncbi:aminotransferase class IV [Maribacter sp. 2307ULW6-5]|uniref:aminotransferase class IV n=1 Tax=Maribacter sp. 2307ULW6-5 TaxID=3386275 RepID=UPI0039BD7170
MDIDFDVQQLPEVIKALLDATGLTGKDCLLYVQITRGVAPRTHAFPKNVPPTVMLYALPKTLPPINEAHAQVVTAKDYRWGRCDIKMTSLLGNVMLNEHAMGQGCYETILLRNGVVTEASHCNVFFVQDNVVRTHPANHHILDGITRQIVLALCEHLGLETSIDPVREAEIPYMDEAFLAGTSTQIAAIKQCNDHCFYQGNKLGNITQKLQTAFLKLKAGKLTLPLQQHDPTKTP